MSRRSFLYGLLTGDAGLTALVGDRIFQGSSMLTATTVKPYIVYHLGNNTGENLAEEHPASRYFFQIYVYDEVGDYTQVDDIGDLLKALLTGTGDEAEGIMTTRFLERSQDFIDETLVAAFNYLRFQWVSSG